MIEVGQLMVEAAIDYEYSRWLGPGKCEHVHARTRNAVTLRAQWDENARQVRHVRVSSGHVRYAMYASMNVMYNQQRTCRLRYPVGAFGPTLSARIIIDLV
jgi:hypothetical protein